MSFVNDWLIPIIKILIFTGFFGFIGFIVIKAFYNGWTKRYKFVIRHQILKKPYSESIVNWCIKIIEDDISYYDAKKFLMVKSIPTKEINEMLWVYEQLKKKMKGGVKHGRKFKGVSNEVTSKQNIPEYSTADIPKD